MTLHVHLLENFDPPVIEALRARLNAAVHLTTGPEVAPEAEVLVAGAPAAAHLAAPRLRAVVVPFTGIAPGTRTVMLAHPHLTLHNSRWPTLPTAEGALTLLLAAAKFVLPADRAFRQHNWEMRYAPSPSILLAGKTVAVLGFGAIGTLIGQMCHSLGMRVLGVRRGSGPARPTAYPAEVHPVSALRTVLPQASILIVTLPLTAETTGLIGAEELRLLARPAFLVNVGRGPVIDEGALYHALKDGTLTAAGLDVWYTYPTDPASRAHTPPAAYPFHELDNVVMSQHRIDLVREHDDRQVAELAAMLNGAAAGQPLPNQVDVEAGY